MPDPKSYPCVRYWEDGRFVLVETPFDYAQLEPGHADNPSGPFPEGGDEEEERDEAVTGWDEPAPDPRKAEARLLHHAGKTKQAIAEALGVSPRTVGRLLGE